MSQLLRLLLLTLPLLFATAQAQTQISNYAFNNTVTAIAKASDGSTYVGGAFTSVGEYCGTAVKLTNNATSTFNINDVKVVGTVNVIVPNSTGGWYIGGSFTSINGVVRNGLALINADGSLNSFNANVNGVVRLIALNSSGKIYIVGTFTNVGGVARINFACLNPDGSLDELIINFNNVVTAMVFDTIGNLLFGGDFTVVNSMSRNYFAKLNTDGTLNAFNPAVNASVYSIATNTLNEIAIGGAFTSVNGLTRVGLAKFNSDTSLNNFNANFNTNLVRVVKFDASGSLLVGGDFTVTNGIIRNRFAKFNPDGTLNSFNPNLNNFASSIAIDAANNLYIGGNFTTTAGSVRNYFAKYNSDESLNGLNPGFSAAVNTIAINAADTVYIGGAFTTINNQVRNRLAKFNADLTLNDFNPNMSANVNAIAVTTDGAVYAGGTFVTVGGVSRNRLAKFNEDGTLNSFNPNMNSTVNALVLDSSNSLYAGGAFTLAGGATRTRLAKFNADGTLNSFNPNMNSTVNSLVLDTFNNLYAGGAFTTALGVTKNRVAKFNPDGTLNSFNPDINNIVASLALDAANNLYVGGQFTTVGGGIFTRNRLAKFNADGSLSAFNPNVQGTVSSISISPGGSIYTGGQIVSVNGFPRTRFAKFDPDGTLNSLDLNLNTTVSVVLFNNSKLYIGGLFTKRYDVYDNISSSCEISLNNPISASICGTGTAYLSITPSSGIVNWYDAPTGGTLLGTGTTFTTPTISSTTTYYAEAVDGACTTSIRTGVTATQKTLPTLTVGANQTLCNGSATQTTDFTAPSFGTVCATVTEGSNLVLSAPSGSVFNSVNFASYGTPDGTCGNFTIGGCDAGNSVAIVSSYVIGQNSVSIPANNTTFGDPCGGTVKRLSVEAVYGNVTTITWSNDTPSIGLSANGVGNIPSFTAVNNGATPIVATILVSVTENGCTNSIPYTITVNPSASSETITACDSYTWPANAVTYTTSGNYSFVNSCDATQFLNLTVNNSSTTSETITACDSYTWTVNGTTYTASGIYTNTTTNASGCSNVATLNLIINNSSTTSETITACDSYTWLANGTTYTTSGVYTNTTTNASGCSNVATLNLTINNSSATSETITACDSYTWLANGTTYTTSGVYTNTTLNASGCSNVATLNLTIDNSSTTSETITACDSYTWLANGTTYTTSGVYTNTTLNASGCSNVATLNLTINNNSTTSETITACDSYTWLANGTTYSTSGVYTNTTTNASGCSNVATLNLTINNSSTTSETITACNSYTWLANGTTYTSSGVYTNSSINASGCENIATLNLTINDSSTTFETFTTCDSYIWPVNGVYYTTSGIYPAITTNEFGCTVIKILNLTVNTSSTTSETVTACNSYTWSETGATYTTSGIYTNTTTNASFCPNVATLNLTITNGSTSLETSTACNSYTWLANGTTYTTSGVYTNTTTNASGCVNVATLNLTILQSNNYYADADNDGFGNPASSIQSCVTVPGYVLNNTDCNDAAPTVYPGATEICYDGLDNNCNGTIDEGCTPIVTIVQSAQCGVTLATIDQDVFANLVSGAQGYRFRVTNTTTNQVQTIDRFLRVFKITQLPVFAFNTTYQIEVSVRINNVWQPFYGAPCTVSTPATTTQLQSAQCGGTLISMADVIYANNVPFATGYRFRVTNLVTSAQQVLVRNLREFRMNLLTNPSYNATYSIEVAIRNTDGTYLPYGPVCNITTPSFPTSSVQVAQCDYIALSNTEIIYANSFTGATVYRFRLTNPGLGYSYTIDRNLRTFTLGQFPGLQSGTTYTIQVSLQIGGVFGPYGKACSLTTPVVARQETAAPIKQQATAIDFKATAYPNPFASDFKLNVTTSSDEKVQVRVYDMLGKLIEDKQVATTEIENLEVGASYPSGVYNVIVSQGENMQTLRVIKR